MTDLKKYAVLFFKVAIVIATLIINGFLIWMSLYGSPFHVFFIDTTQSTVLPHTKTIEDVLTLLYDITILVTSVFAVIWLDKKQKLFIYAPILTVVIVVYIIIASSFYPKGPFATSGMIKDGYSFKEEWKDTLNGMTIYKRWKSVLPDSQNKNVDITNYLLDSTSLYRETK